MRGVPVLLALGLTLAACSPSAPESELLLATTTSVRDSGLLDALLPEFSERTGVRVRTIAVGSGAALRMGEEGNADVLLTHAPVREKELVASGALASRREFMENHFVIAGPPEDPAEIRDAASAADAYRLMQAVNAPYVSRADDSGTHMRERALLAAAGLGENAAWEAVTRTGSGMGATLQVAGERRAYVLSDLGTFLAFQERTGLDSLSGPDPELRNVYSVMHVSPELFPDRSSAESASALESYFLEPATQSAIARFGVERFGQPLFRPLILDD